MMRVTSLRQRFHLDDGIINREAEIDCPRLIKLPIIRTGSSIEREHHRERNGRCRDQAGADIAEKQKQYRDD